MISIYNLEDYKIIRDGIKYLLTQEPDFKWIGDSRDVDDLYAALDSQNIDIVLLDIYLDGMQDVKTSNGFEICRYITNNYPSVKVIAHSMYDDSDKVVKMFAAGAKGFVSKRTGYDYLIKGIRTVYDGGIFICSESGKNLKNVSDYINGQAIELKAINEFFSKREKEVLELMAKGFLSKDIAKELFITEKTVESHRRNMVQKAKVKNTMELISLAISRGIIKT
ncbi:hypothetical protein CJD36_021085 [Flavipsychrobacter stenotrophus]|uniref:DNA-binding response regulator n=1 Tax=Flavipsychrobacter stenotrophus TaxID=2077091 RepID=A0A2S7SQP8_9BACT|nr:response regulator transcription factor [Flavipsychrobacter stenotrophus]PQJ09074.1 hypothetical protein CJD36_021085 [Flavipsychrobacter stenotrophus]